MTIRNCVIAPRNLHAGNDRLPVYVTSLPQNDSQSQHKIGDLAHIVLSIKVQRNTLRKGLIQN